ncbi:PSP1 C-terminal conserved region [Metschnikowia aff. pulcherrima]|uniref:PSP1 C-terminal conserved region n=1 Tax=Metschnikowia aff. pulcherrima TaxID=2163413 RepID=A0A4P6XLV9_9ASCO|nr:PSP1 C-terminal conserved region [Metschnikowia aff. pulcherrima]
MDFNYPDFLNEKGSFASSLAPPNTFNGHSSQGTEHAPESGLSRQRLSFSEAHLAAFRNPDFDSLLHSKLAFLDQNQDTVSPLQSTLAESPRAPVFSGFNNQYQDNYQPLGTQQFSFQNTHIPDPFHLPQELQGGIGNISSRRPSFAAESFTRSGPAYLSPPPTNPPLSATKNSLASLAAANNFSKNYSNTGYEQMTESLGNFHINLNFLDFQARRPSQLVDFPLHSTQNAYYNPYQNGHFQAAQNPTFPGQNRHFPDSASVNYERAPNGNHQMKLDNKLMLKDQHILSTAELKTLFASVSRYYQDPQISSDIVAKLRNLLQNDAIRRLIAFVKNLNNLNMSHKMLCLVINKNGKLDLLSYPNNSNIYLQAGDMVIVDGDRGKDLVMVLEPLVPLDMAVLFNFLKKIEHLRSLTIVDSKGSSLVKNSHWAGAHLTSLDASTIVNSHLNEDNEFIINLPTKQVLRFATPKEIHRLSGKFLEEKKAFVTCYNKIKELGLSNDLTLVNVEYQFDYKKLIFYYFAKFKRIDFRDLIKELFKIYKTRIWLCAVLPYDQPELYTKIKKGLDDESIKSGKVPKEYGLTTDQIMTFSVDDLRTIPSPSYFHLRNMANLIDNLQEDVKGEFYGFNKSSPPDSHATSDGRRKLHLIQPNFNPFGATENHV